MIIVDLDGDGIQEIIAGRSVYSPTGEEICQGEGPTDGFATAADLDLDGQGSLLLLEIRELWFMIPIVQ